MLKNTEDKEDKGWELTLGFYPGVLFGMRSYLNKDYKHVYQWFIILLKMAIWCPRLQQFKH